MSFLTVWNNFAGFRKEMKRSVQDDHDFQGDVAVRASLSQASGPVEDGGEGEGGTVAPASDLS